ncbi:MAG: hypothetical protein LBC30_01575 [Puniceicoccales bacterium]|jgi:hypothetical protein|nr:hypothetical protein [Puniceicoccales bacterium]
MDGVERMRSILGYGQLAMRPKEDSDTTDDEDFVIGGSKKVNVPQAIVPDDALGTRSEIVPRFPKGSGPTSWLECTVENTANLVEDKIVQLLFFQGRFDVSKLALILLLPDGDRIATQLANGMSGNRLLESIGGDATSVDDFMCIFFPEEYFVKDIGEVPTLEQIANSTRAECEFPSQDLSKEKFDEQIDMVSQATIDTFTHKDRRENFEGQLGGIADSIARKFPPSNAENQKCWDNIFRGVKAMIDESHRANGDGEKKLKRAKEIFPAFDISFSRS